MNRYQALWLLSFCLLGGCRSARHTVSSAIECLNEALPSPEIAASHILLPTIGEANKAHALLKSGRSFEAVAEAMSADRETARRGGSMGTLKVGDQDPEFDRALAALKVGQISGVLRTNL